MIVKGASRHVSGTENAPPALGTLKIVIHPYIVIIEFAFKTLNPYR